MAAHTMGVELQSLPVRSTEQYEAAFQAASAWGADARLPLAGDFLLNSHAAPIVEFAAKQQLPALHPVRYYVDAGGLMADLPNQAALYRRTATYVDCIIKGTKPADLSVEQPATFEFSINLKTAQALGLTIPEHVLQQATQIAQ